MRKIKIAIIIGIMIFCSVNNVPSQIDAEVLLVYQKKNM